MKTSPISLRFVFNRQARTFDRAYSRRAARFTATQVAIAGSQELWAKIERDIKAKIERDLTREVAAIAQQYTRMVVGRAAGWTGLAGTIKSASGSGPGAGAVQMVVNQPWPARDYDYLRRKNHERGHTRWYDYGGRLGRAMAKPGTWIRAFGPISVSVLRTVSGAPRKGLDLLDTGYSDKTITVDLATITVRAFGRITPAMLPALARGGSGAYPRDGRKTGLVGLLPPTIAYRVAGNERFVPYRHTIEPFLDFFLTRAIPNAVVRRLDDGLKADILRV